MDRKCFVVAVALVLGLVASSFGDMVVVGDFETGLDGWVARDDGFEIARTAKVSSRGNQSLKITGKTGWGAAAQLGGFQQHLPSLGKTGAIITADVTAFQDEMPDATWLQVGFVVQGQNVSWTTLGHYGIPRDGTTNTYTWELPNDLIEKIAAQESFTWGQLIIYTNSAVEKSFYIDNIQIGTPADEEGTVIGDWEQELDGWRIDPAFSDFLYNDSNGVTLGNYSLDLYKPDNAGWQRVMDLDVIEANLVDVLKEHTSLKIDVTTLVEYWPESPTPSWNEVVVRLHVDGENYELVKGARWVQSDGDNTTTLVAEYGHLLSELNYFDNVSTLRIDIFFNVGNYEGPISRILDNARLVGGGEAFAITPLDEAQNVGVDTSFVWTPGTFAALNHLYIGTDATAVEEAVEASDPNVMFIALDVNNYTPEAPLAYGTDYFWRVDGINDSYDNSPWIGKVWSFKTANFINIEDFEDYNNYDIDSGECIFDTWIDGEGDDNNGSYVWNAEPPFLEDETVHTGKWGMPLYYGESENATVSKATRIWDEPQDWTVDGLNAYDLTLYIYGWSENIVGTLSITLEDVDGDSATTTTEADLFTVEEWTAWKFVTYEMMSKVDLTKVTKMVISVTDIAGQPKAKGNLFIDDIRGYFPIAIDYLNIPKSMTKPVIDGQWDAAWDDINETEMLIWDFPDADSAEPEDANDLSGLFKAFYDEDNFYLFVEIWDSVINAGNSSWQGDGIEIYFDGDNSKGAAYDGVNDNQIRITVDDVDLTGIQHKPDVDVDGTEFKVLLTDKGYNIEVAFPLEKLHINPTVDPEPLYTKDGQAIPGSEIAPSNIIGFELQINDNDLETGDGRESMLRWFSNSNNSWQWPHLFGYGRTTGTSE